MLLQKLHKKGLIHPPDWLLSNTHYLTIMGSHAYGTNKENSDYDIYGFCTPKKEVVFPHLGGEILGFGRQIKRFEQWEEKKIFDKDADNREYGFDVYNIVKYFTLLMENNPNIIDSLWTPMDCILHITSVGNMVRDNRKIFLHKGCWHKFKGYSYSQLHKMNTKERENQEIIDRVLEFEKKTGLSREIKFSDVEVEVKRRSLECSISYIKPPTS